MDGVISMDISLLILLLCDYYKTVSVRKWTFTITPITDQLSSCVLRYFISGNVKIDDLLLLLFHPSLHLPPEIKRATSMMSFFRTYLNSPVGPKTTHFWGPVANWGFVAAAMADIDKPPEMLSGNMTAVMCVYSGLCMRFAWMIRPRNYLLLACHASNETVQLYQFSRWAKGQGYLQLKEDKTSST